MSELVLKIGTRGPDPDWQDGDIMCAYNQRAIRCVHAQHLCHVQVAKRNSVGLILPDDLSRDWFELTHQYRFERISHNEVRRTEIATGVEEVFSNQKNKDGVRADVALWVRRRRLQPNHFLFGEDGREVWYGGRIDLSSGPVARIWDVIEGKTSHRREQASRWPAGTQELKSHLFVETDDFDDTEANELVSQEVDEESVIARRANKIDWEADLGLKGSDISAIKRRDVAVDLRGELLVNRASKVKRKQRRDRDAGINLDAK